MQKHNAEELIRKYLAGNCTAEEKALVESWHLEELAAHTYVPGEEQITLVHQRMQAALSQHIQATRPRAIIKRTWFRMTAAALLAGCIFGFGYLYYIKAPRTETVVLDKQQTILPGHNGAVLTLADGRAIMLDSLGNGLLAEQPGTKVLLNNGQLTYQADSTNSAASSYNTISTPRGRQFKIALPDGSLVWLNAASSLRYPTAFTGSERKVFVTGEAYFEVNPLTPKGGKKIPFKVIIPPHSGGTEGAEVEVLGTHFNINAYEDEETASTTLLEGSVKVMTGDWSRSKEKKQAVILKPGQQASISGQQNSIQVLSADVNAVVAWKNGVFNFQDATLEIVMRQLARWYDLEVVYQKGIPDIAFEGEINRQNELTSVLHSLERLGVHFELKGRRLTVLP
jgi:ferric-dicitrate binding protein FerR (iron transport regulator)